MSYNYTRNIRPLAPIFSPSDAPFTGISTKSRHLSPKNDQLALDDSWIGLAVREGRISEVVWLEDFVVLVEGPGVHVERIEQTSDGFEMEIHGHGETELLTQLISHRRGDPWTLSGAGTASGKRGAWDAVQVAFAACSVESIKLTTAMA